MAKRKKKVALVTDASSGVGTAIARKQLKDGSTVIVAARRGDMMQDLAEAGADVLSMDGPCADLGGNIAKASEDPYQDGAGTSPDVVAKTVSQATKSRRPKTRYAAGKYATLLLFMRKWFSDRLFQRVVMSMAR